MRISEILENIDYIDCCVSEKHRDKDIRFLCHNSRYAAPGCLFICKVGPVSDGHAYAQHAYRNGARVFIAEHKLELPKEASVIIVKDSSDALCKLSVLFYSNPSADLRVIGVTGTKGKTTVALSVYYIALANGINAGYIGTNGIYYNGKVFETANTTPDVLELQKYLRDMKNSGVSVVIIEVSSQALWQKRVYGINFDTCVFTNLYEDHIGGVEHPTWEHYRDCKKLLFSDYSPQHIIVNSDSDESEYMLDGIECKSIIKTSAKGRSGCDFCAENANLSKDGVKLGISFDLKCSSLFGEIDECEYSNIFVPSPGLYSVENALLVLAVCSVLGISINNSISKLSELKIPGRFETVELEEKSETLFVIDYAHNGASLSAVLKSLSEYEHSSIICLFGSVGGRTFGRRAELARAAGEGADVIIVTSDNPNNEDPMSVISDINDALEGCNKSVYLIPDREKAIEKAYSIAQKGDIVLLAGKGHESYQLINGERIPFSERKILELLDIKEPSLK